MQAVILAGGKGARLRPYTVVLPKPLMPVGDYPILEVVIRQLKKHGFEEIILAVGHQKELLRAFFGNGEKWGVSIQYSSEDSPLGTAGPLKHIVGLQDQFLLMNGDILTDANFRTIADFHLAEGCDATIVTHKRHVNIDYGTLEYDAGGRLLSYNEKPTLHYDVSMGIYMLSRQVRDYIPSDGPFDFPNLIERLLEDGRTVLCYPCEGYWLDIGRPDDYEIAIHDFERMKDELL